MSKLRSFNFILVKLTFFLLVFSTLSLYGSDIHEVIAVYLTWQKQPDSTMTIQWITPNDQVNDTIYFQENGQPFWELAQGRHFPMPENNPYFIHRVELTNLKENSIYFFHIGAEGSIYKFRTMPRRLETPIRFVVGGDMYHDSLDFLEKTSQQAAQTNPMFALIGGDIAYGVGKKNTKKEDAHRWLNWFVAWNKNMVTPDGCLIPIIPAIGNHETKGWFERTPEKALFFYTFFPMPGLQGYNVLDFGHYLSILMLDSWHTHPIDGKQKDWISTALKIRQTVPHKFAFYHVPAYPSHGRFDFYVSREIRNHWVPIFEDFGLNAAFEHHCHTYKRSFPIAKNKIDPKGVLYLGDGAWGVAYPRRPKTPTQAWYLAKTASLRHFILVILQPSNQRFYYAIDQDGNLIDEYVQK